MEIIRGTELSQIPAKTLIDYIEGKKTNSEYLRLYRLCKERRVESLQDMLNLIAEYKDSYAGEAVDWVLSQIKKAQDQLKKNTKNDKCPVIYRLPVHPYLVEEEKRLLDELSRQEDGRYLPIERFGARSPSGVLSKCMGCKISELKELATSLNYPGDSNGLKSMGIAQRKTYELVVKSIIFHEYMAIILMRTDHTNTSNKKEEKTSISNESTKSPQDVRKKVLQVNTSKVRITSARDFYGHFEVKRQLVAEQLATIAKYIIDNPANYIWGDDNKQVRNIINSIHGLTQKKPENMKESPSYINIHYYSKMLTDLLARHLPLSYIEKGITTEQEILAITEDGPTKINGRPIDYFLADFFEHPKKTR